MSNTIHGMYRTATYRSWHSMHNRCYDPNSDSYKSHGGRGVIVCKRWHEFVNFFEDMGLRPQGMTIDRKNNNGNYHKRNCRWATQLEQNNNTLQNILLTYNRRKQTVSQWARELGIKHATLISRINRGWSTKKILTQPIDTTCYAHAPYDRRPDRSPCVGQT